VIPGPCGSLRISPGTAAAFWVGVNASELMDVTSYAG
jgi:hypothetical protein